MSEASLCRTLANNKCSDVFTYQTYTQAGTYYVGVKMTFDTKIAAHVQAFEVIDPCLANDWTYTTFTYTDYDYFNL